MKILKKLLSNERGSVLSVSLIVIALLSFSLSVVTNDTLNLTGQTTTVQKNIQDTSYGKKILDIALQEMKDFILASSSSNPVDDYLNGSYEDTGGSFADYIEGSYGVVSTDVTLEEELDPLAVAAIKLSLLLEDGVTISRTTYYSFLTEVDNDLTGSAAVAQILNDPENFDPDDPYEINFYFSLVTNGDLIMNGGYYNFPAIYAGNIYMHNRAAYVWNDVSNETAKQQFLTPAYDGSDPRYKYDNFTKIFYDLEYQYCLDSGCITPGDATTDTIINKSLYSDVVGSSYPYSGDPQDYKLDEFFTSFDFDANFLDFLQNTAPNSALDTTLTMANYESVILSNSVPYGSTGPFVNVTDNWSSYLSSKDRNFSIVIESSKMPGGVFTLDQQLMLESDAYTIVVLGDMIIDGAGAKNANQNEHTIIGNLVVTGDITLTGGADMKKGDEMSLINTIITLGNVTFDFDPGVGLDNTKNGSVNTDKFSGLVLLAKGNILFNSFNESHVPLTSEEINLYAFIYSEESVFIDAVNSHIRLEGAIYARARGVSGDYLPYKDEEGNQIHGIIINSFNGYINDANEPNVNGSDIVRFHMTNLTVDRMQLAFDGLPRFEVQVRSDEYFVDDGYVVE